MNNYRLLVFDWDGTLADSASIIVDAIQRACVDLKQPMPSDAAARYVIGLGLQGALQHVAPGLSQTDYPQLSERYRNYFLAREEEITLFEGVESLLAELDSRGVLLAVATGKSRRGLDRALLQTRLKTYFAATRCADEGFPKPHPDMLLHLLDYFGIGPEQTLMIGDTTHDIELARNAGVDALAVSYGAHQHEHLVSAQPLACVASVAELQTWLKQNT